MSEHGYSDEYLAVLDAVGQYQDADLPDAPKEPEEAPERDPEVEEKAQVTVYGIDVTEWDNRWLQFEKTMAAQSERIDTLTGAVNQFGAMLDFITQSVSQVGKQISEGGLSGIMGMLKGVKE